MKTIGLALIVAMAVGATYAGPVYRCTVDGKTAYSDAPCLGAKEVDVTPTEGMNKWTGKEQKAPALVTKQMTDTLRKGIAQSVSQIAPLTEETLKREEQRASLAPEATAECARLDGTLKSLKAQETPDETALYNARMRFFKLKC